MDPPAPRPIDEVRSWYKPVAADKEETTKHAYRLNRERGESKRGVKDPHQYSKDHQTKGDQRVGTFRSKDL